MQRMHNRSVRLGLGPFRWLLGPGAYCGISFVADLLPSVVASELGQRLAMPSLTAPRELPALLHSWSDLRLKFSAQWLRVGCINA